MEKVIILSMSYFRKSIVRFLLLFLESFLKVLFQVKSNHHNITSMIDCLPSLPRYTPVDSLTGRVLPQRMVRVVEVAKDPLDPPNYHHHKVPTGFGDAAVPILHSPPRKVTVQDMQDWKIPPCISNWKNARGLTIPLDKRLAADGRGLQQTEVNDNFATFAEALQAAESKMREEVELRNSIIRKEKEKERITQDELIRQRAAEVHQQREDMEKARDHRLVYDKMIMYRETAEERAARIERDKQREAMRKQREKDNRLKQAGRRTKAEREAERDISERIALGQAAVSTSSGATFDSRLFDQNGGLGSGQVADDGMIDMNRMIGRV